VYRARDPCAHSSHATGESALDAARTPSYTAIASGSPASSTMRQHDSRHTTRSIGHGGFFSLGGLLARVWRTRNPATPWVCASSVLAAGAIWDKMRTGGPVDFVLLGLAGYELVIGLTEEPVPTALAPSTERVDEAGAAAR
jgi:hypothetical protein